MTPRVVRGALAAALLATGACAGAAGPAPTTAPTTARTSPAASAASAPAANQEPVAASDAPAPCPLKLSDKLGGTPSVLVIPEKMYRQALTPVIDAVCACTRRGDQVRVVARIVPERGEVRASAPESSAVDACLADRLNPGRFEPLEVGGTDCIDCGPRHMPSPARPATLEGKGLGPASHAPAAPAPPARPVTTITYPLDVDRTSE